ncbi:helix-turn-helix domain-containing protein [Actinosynnema sp. CA-299493]
MEDDFGDLVKRGRGALGWTQRDLARRMGVGQQAVSAWERGLARPEDAVIARLAEELPVDFAPMRGTAGSHEKAIGPVGVRSPIKPLLIKLPLHELPPDVFEQFSADLTAALHPDSEVHRYGGQGHTQHGIDVIVRHPDGTTTGVQCKREQKFGPVKIAEAVGKLTLEVDRCRIFLTRVASPQARQEIGKYSSWELWDVDDLSAAVRSLPDRDAAVRLVDTYFPGWREAFLGVASAGSWLTAEEFFRPYARDRIYSHVWQLVGRDDALADLLSWAGNRDRRETIALLVGRGGIGKTRLLRALADELVEQGRNSVRFLAMNAAVDMRDFEQLPPDDGLVVVVDDVHDRTDMATIVAGVRRFRPRAKVLLSLRPYGRTSLLADLRQVGVHPSEIPTWELNDLTIPEAEALARCILGADTESWVARRLAEAAPDCPLLVVVGANLIAKGMLDPGRLEADEGVREEILSAFRDVVVDTPGGVDAELRREVLHAIAALQPFRLDQPDFQQAASTLTGRPFDHVMRHVRALQEAGVLIRRGESVRIVPDLLGDVVLAEAAVDGPSGLSTGYLERVCQATADAPLLHAMVNASRVDWQTRNRGGSRSPAVEVLWNALLAAFEAGTEHHRHRILEMVRQVAAFQPAHAMVMVRTALGRPAGDGRVDWVPAATIDGGLIRELPGILHRIALHFDHLQEAVDLLWWLARWDTRPPHQHPEHPMRVLTDLAEYTANKPTAFQDRMITAVQRWLREDDIAEHPYSPFAVLEPMLATEAEERHTDGLTLILRPLAVVADVVRPIRDRVVDVAFTEARADDVRRAVCGVQALEAAIRYPIGMFGRPVDDIERSNWMPVFVDVIERMAELVTGPGVEPVVAVAVRKAVAAHAHYAEAGTNPAAQAVIAALPDDVEYRLAHVLHDGWGPSLPDMDDYYEHSRRQRDYFTSLAADMCNRWPPDDVVEQILQRLVADHYAHRDSVATPAPFVWTLARNHPEVGVELVKRVASDSAAATIGASDPSVVLRELVAVVLGALTESLPDEAMNLARALLDTPDLHNARAVAHAFSWGRGNRATLLDGEAELLRTLAVHGDPDVRRLAVSATRMLGEQNRDLARQLVTGVRFSDSKALAGEVAAVLATPGPLSWRELTSPDRADLFEQLHDCPSLDEHHITTLLTEMSAEHSEQVLELLLRRVETYERSDHTSRYEPLPFRWHKPLRFTDSTHFEQHLRHVLAWIAEHPKSWIRERMGSQIFAAVSGGFHDQVLKILSDALRSGSRAHVLAAGVALNEAPRDFAWTRTAFVIEALTIAERYDEDCVKAIGGALHSATVRGMRVGTPGEPFQEDVEQRDKATQVAARLPLGSIEHRFFTSLASAAESQIRWQLDRDERLNDRRTW